MKLPETPTIAIPLALAEKLCGVFTEQASLLSVVEYHADAKPVFVQVGHDLLRGIGLGHLLVWLRDRRVAFHLGYSPIERAPGWYAYTDGDYTTGGDPLPSAFEALARLIVTIHERTQPAPT